MPRNILYFVHISDTHIGPTPDFTRHGHNAYASTFSQFAAWPDDRQVQYDPDHPPGYSFVHLLPEQTIIHQHTFPRPDRPAPAGNAR